MSVFCSNASYTAETAALYEGRHSTRERQDRRLVLRPASPIAIDRQTHLLRQTDRRKHIRKKINKETDR